MRRRRRFGARRFAERIHRNQRVLDVEDLEVQEVTLIGPDNVQMLPEWTKDRILKNLLKHTFIQEVVGKDLHDILAPDESGNPAKAAI